MAHVQTVGHHRKLSDRERRLVKKDTYDYTEFQASASWTGGTLHSTFDWLVKRDFKNECNKIYGDPGSNLFLSARELWLQKFFFFFIQQANDSNCLNTARW